MNWSAMEDILITLGLIAGAVGIIWLRARVHQVRLAKQAETQQQLLAKFQSGHELAEFIATEDGKRFLRQFESDPHRTMLVILSAGIVSAVVGLGFLVLMRWEDGFLFPSVVTMALAVGLILAALVSKKLSDEWRQ